MSARVRLDYRYGVTAGASVKVRLAGICSSLQSIYIDTNEIIRVIRQYFTHLK
jgi:hypothetical protein